MSNAKMAVKDPTKVPDLSGKSLRYVLRMARQYGVYVVPSGTGVVIEQSPAAGAGNNAGTWRVRFGGGRA